MSIIPYLTAPLWFWLISACVRCIHHDLTAPQRPVSRDWRIIP